MYLMTHHNPLQGISFRVTGLARTRYLAERALKHYYSGSDTHWEELLYQESPMWIRWIDKGAGICYVIQEVEVFE